MSESDDSSRLLDMLTAAELIVEHTAGVSASAFAADRLLQSAVLNWLTVVGEAANHVSDETRAMYTEIPWPQVVGMRNRIVHEYLRIDTGLILDTAQRDLPQLIVALRRAISS